PIGLCTCSARVRHDVLSLKSSASCRSTTRERIGRSSLVYFVLRSPNCGILLSPMSQENVEIVREAFEAFNEGNLEAVVSICDPAIEWLPPPELPSSSAYHG